jgi:hypothetical protein
VLVAVDDSTDTKLESGMKRILVAPAAAAVLLTLAMTAPTLAGATTIAPAAKKTTGSISGKVEGPNGKPVAGTCVVMFTPTSIVSFPTKKNGDYKATGLLGQTEAVGQICSGSAAYAPVVYKDHPGLEGNSNIDQDIDVTAGSNTKKIDIDLAQGGSVDVTVDDAVTGDPVDNAEVCPYLPNLDADGDTVQSGYCNFTGSNGVADLGNEVAGPNVVAVYGPSGYGTSFYNGQSSFATANQIELAYNTTTDITVDLAPTGS